MKNIFRLLLILSFGMVIYSIFFWEPKDKKKYDLEEKTEETICNNTEKNIDIDNAKLKMNYTRPIFKVSEQVLERSIKEEDKNKIDSIINKMSEIDIDQIRKEENNEDREDKFRRILKILNKRLSSKDYKVIKNIYDPYIDFTNI